MPVCWTKDNPGSKLINTNQAKMNLELCTMLSNETKAVHLNKTEILKSGKEGMGCKLRNRVFS